jgi:type IV pilus assembly protein PilN
MQARLNLATKPLESHRKFLVGTGLLGTVAAVIFLVLGWHVYSVRKADEEMRARTAEMLRQMAVLDQQGKSLEQFFNQDEIKKLDERSVFLNGIIHARSFNWTRMFMDLEKLLPAGVRVVSIEPKQEKGRVEVKFTVGATSDDAQLKFMKALETSKTFSNVQFIARRAPSPGSAGEQMLVELTAEYAST